MPAEFTPIIKTVSTAGSAVQVSTTSKIIPGVLVRAFRTNVGEIYIGQDDASSTTGFPISPGDTLTLRSETRLDLLSWYVDADTDGNKAAFAVLENE